MFIFVLLTLFAEWIWVDATERISMGLEFPVYSSQEIIFTDLDGDGDEDMIRGTTPPLKAFENTLSGEGNRLWNENPTLIHGIDCEGGINSLGRGDLFGNGTDEIVVRKGNYLLAYVNNDTAWEPDSSYFDGLAEDFVPWYPDFADVDGDGDLDMAGGWGVNEAELVLGMWWNQGTAQNPEWEFDSTYFTGGEYWERAEHPCWIDYNGDGTWDLLFTQWFWADPPPYGCHLIVLQNNGSGTSPIWETKGFGEMLQLDDLTLLDWNEDEVEDLLITNYQTEWGEFTEGYYYIPGRRIGDSLAFDFEHPSIWGGILGQYPAVADVNDDDIPEFAITDNGIWYDFFGTPSWASYLRNYNATNPQGTYWRREDRTLFWSADTNYVHSQYVNFGNDHLVDYVLSSRTGCSLYHNQGTKTDPDWVMDSSALVSLPPLFPTCFLDVDGDGDKDVIGFSVEDSVLAGFLNTGSDNNPRYGRYDQLVTGFEGIDVTYLAAGDITDNDLDLPDLAVNIVGDGLTAFFNSGQANPRWHRHDEVFKNLGVGGNPALCDADGDGDLDLYLVTGGRLHYYRNESTGGIAETPPTYLPRVSMTYIEREVEVSLTVAQSDGEVRFLLYNAAGQRVMASSQKPRDGEVRFRISQQPGVYFYRASTKELEITGKVVLH